MAFIRCGGDNRIEIRRSFGFFEALEKEKAKADSPVRTTIGLTGLASKFQWGQAFQRSAIKLNWVLPDVN